MKSSNPQVMVQAYRLLVKQMLLRGKVYPLHLGVTEAGDGEDGRIKSALGIGALLEDGIGDTVRVSLTEDPEFELPVCRNLIERYNLRSGHTAIAAIENAPFQPYDYKRFVTQPVGNIGATQVPVVVADYSEMEIITRNELSAIGYSYNPTTDKWNIGDAAADYIFTKDQILNFDLPGTLKEICNYKMWWNVADKTKCFPLFPFKDYLRATNKSSISNFVLIDDKTLMAETKLFFNQIQALEEDRTLIWVFETENIHAMPALRRMFFEQASSRLHQPIITKRGYELKVDDRFMLYGAIDLGALLLDGMGDGIWLTNTYSDRDFINRTSFNILQASRTRISKTEYISCPSCGRTLFDLQETTAAIRAKTAHLKGLKIAVMGCIVNGPGEMADADFGYVGSGVGKITLYKGREVVKRQVDSHVAVDELINLIKENGRWVDVEN
jgi:(E)-4-hydroxy-3-methylbut-2-enyl-diphosphate synthase